MKNNKMTHLLVLFGIYVTFETINYIIQSMHHDKLNKTRYDKNHDRKTVYLTAKVIQDDFEHHVKDLTSTIDCMFCNSINTFPRQNIINSLKRCILYPFHDDTDDDKSGNYIENIVTKYENINNINLKDDNNILNIINIIKWHENDLKVWYKPLLMLGIYETISTYSDYMMIKNGFTKTVMEDGLIIWYRNDEHSNNAILFVHACAGGLPFQLEFITKVDRKYAFVVPEIPGISFGNRVDIPPSICSMAKSVTDFIISKDLKTLQMISHSFGGNISAHIINNYYNKLKKENITLKNTILIEPIIFLPTLPHIHKLLNKDLTIQDILYQLKNDHGRLITYLILLRDIYTQFYSQRTFFVSDILLGNTEYEKNNTINIIYCENDELSPIEECVHYLQSKKYNCNLKVYKGRSHGDFCLNSDMQNYVISLIK